MLNSINVSNGCYYHLIFVQVSIGQLLFALFLEGYDNESDEYIDEEKWENDKVDHIKQGHFHSVKGLWALILISGVHTVLANAEAEISEKSIKDEAKLIVDPTLAILHQL